MATTRTQFDPITREVMASKKTSLIEKVAGRYSVDPGKLMNTLKATAFKQRNNEEITNEQMMALLVVADQYKLNPFTKEIYAFPDKQNGIVPIVGVDGWSRMMNENEYFDGIDFNYADKAESLDDDHKLCPQWIECVIYRKDRDHPTKVKEYLDEVYRPAFEKKGQNGYKVKGPWQTHTKRMLRHKAMIQAARVAFGFVGIYDEDEADRIIEAEFVREPNGEQSKAEDINAIINDNVVIKPAEDQVNAENEPPEEATGEPAGEPAGGTKPAAGRA